MALSFWRRRSIDPMPRRNLEVAMRGGGDPFRAPSDDYLVEGTEDAGPAVYDGAGRAIPCSRSY